MALCAKTQTFFVQMSLSYVDSVGARKILSMQMADFSLSCYTQPLNNKIFIIHDFFWIIPLSVTPIRILPVNQKDLEILDELNLMQKNYLFTVESR